MTEIPRTAARIYLLAWAIGFTTLAVYGSLVPLAYRPLEMNEAIERFRRIPYLEISTHLRADWVANILLFIPLGFFWLGTISYGLGRVWSSGLGLLVAVASAGASVLLEFTQLWFPPRTVSQNDIIAETIGGAVGCVLWLFIGEHAVAWLAPSGRRVTPKDRVRRLLLAYCIGYALYSVMPLDITISISELYDKYQNGQMRLIPFTYRFESVFALAYSLVRDVLCLMPVGAYAAVCLLPARRAYNGLGRSLAFGMAYVVLLEFSQLLIVSRYTDTTDVVTGFFGVAAGIAVMRRGVNAVDEKSRSARPSSAAAAWAAAAAAFAVVLVLGYWYPYDFSLDRAVARQRLDAFGTALFTPMYWGSEFNALGGIMLKTITFAILGGCLAMAIAHAPLSRPARRTLQFLAVVVCGALGLGIELGQILLPHRVAHITDVLLFGVGAALGVVGVSSIRSLAR
jgi:glycopeptide antibiotics resistance protein